LDHRSLIPQYFPLGDKPQEEVKEEVAEEMEHPPTEAQDGGEKVSEPTAVQPQAET